MKCTCRQVISGTCLHQVFLSLTPVGSQVLYKTSLQEGLLWSLPADMSFMKTAFRQVKNRTCLHPGICETDTCLQSDLIKIQPAGRFLMKPACKHVINETCLEAGPNWKMPAGRYFWVCDWPGVRPYLRPACRQFYYETSLQTCNQAGISNYIEKMFVSH